MTDEKECRKLWNRMSKFERGKFGERIVSNFLLWNDFELIEYCNGQESMFRTRGRRNIAVPDLQIMHENTGTFCIDVKTKFKSSIYHSSNPKSEDICLDKDEYRSYDIFSHLTKSAVGIVVVELCRDIGQEIGDTNVKWSGTILLGSFAMLLKPRNMTGSQSGKGIKWPRKHFDELISFSFQDLLDLSNGKYKVPDLRNRIITHFQSRLRFHQTHLIY